MKARESTPGVSSKNSKASNSLLSGSFNILSELEAAYQTPTLWDSEEKKPTVAPVKSNTKLKDLYLEKFSNVHHVQDPSTPSNTRKSSSVVEQPIKQVLQEPRQNDELTLTNFMQFNPRQTIAEEKPTIKGRFEQFMNRCNSPELQRSIPTLNFAPLTTKSPATPTPKNRTISQMSIEELLALTSKRSDNMFSVQMRQGENIFTTPSKFSESNSVMDDSYQNDTPTIPNKIASKFAPQMQTPQKPQKIAPTFKKHQPKQSKQPKSTLEDNYRSRPRSENLEKNQDQKNTSSPESKDRSISYGNDPEKSHVIQSNLEAYLKSKDLTIAKLKKEYKKLLETSKQDDVDRNKEVGALQAKLIKALEEKEKTQKEFENLRERVTIYEKSNSASESSRMKRELSHQVNNLHLREISLEERLVRLEQCLKEEKEKNLKLNVAVLEWKSRWNNRKRNGSGSQDGENLLQAAISNLENQKRAVPEELFRDPKQNHSTNEELKKLKASLNEMTTKLKEMQNNIVRERTKRVQVEEELVEIKTRLSEQLKKPPPKIEAKLVKSESNNEKNLKVGLLLKDEELKRAVAELNEHKSGLIKAQDMIKILKDKESEREKALKVQEAEARKSNQKVRDSKSLQTDLKRSKEFSLETTLKDTQARENALREEVKEKQAQIENLYSKLTSNINAPTEALELGRFQAQNEILDSEKQACRITLDKLISKISLLAKHVNPDSEDLTPEATLDRTVEKLAIGILKNQDIKPEIQEKTEDFLRLQADYENLSLQREELSRQLSLNKKEAETFKNSADGLSIEISKLQNENQELNQFIQEAKSIEKTSAPRSEDAANLQLIQNLEREIETKKQVIISFESSHDQLNTKLTETLEELALRKEEIEKLLALQESKESTSSVSENQIEALKTELTTRETQLTRIQKEYIPISVLKEKEEKIEELRLVILRLQQDNSYLKSLEKYPQKPAASETDTNTSFSEEKFKKLEETNTNLESKLYESRSRITGFEHDIVSLQDYITVLKNSQQVTEEDSDQKIVTANDTIMGLKEVLNENKMESERLISQKNQELVALQNSLIEAEKVLEVIELAKEEEVKILNEELIFMQNKIQTLESELKAKEQSLISVHENLKDPATLKAREKELEGAREGIKESDINVKSNEDQISKITAQAAEEKSQHLQEMQTLLQKIKECEKTSESLRNELAAERAKISNASEFQEELRKAHEEKLSAIESRHTLSLQEKEAVLSAQQQEVIGLKEQINNHEALLADFKQSSSTSEDGLKVELSEKESKISQLLSQISELRSEKQSLSEQLSEIQERISKFEQDNAQQKLINEKETLSKTNLLQTQIIDYEKKIAYLEGELVQKTDKSQETAPFSKLLHEAVTEESMTHLNESLSHAEATIQDLQGQLTALLVKVSAGEETSKQLEAQKVAVKQLEENKRDLVQENELLKVRAEEMEQQVAKFKQNRMNARKSIRGEENIAVVRLREEVRMREEQILSLEKSNKDVKDHYELQIKNANESIQNLRSEQAKLAAAKGGVPIDKKAQMRVQEFEGMNTMLEQQLEHFRFLFEDQEKRVKENEKQTKELSKKLQETEEDFEKLKHEQEETHEEVEGLKTNLDSHKKLLKKYQDQNKTLMTEKDDIASKLTECDTALEHYKNEMSRYIGQIEEVQNREHEVRKENDVLKKKKGAWKLF